MATYLHLFKDEEGFNEKYNSDKYKEPWVSLTRENDEIFYNKEPIINFAPTGYSYTYADFGVTDSMINRWIEMIDNEEPYENFGVTVMSHEINEAYVLRNVQDSPYEIQFIYYIPDSFAFYIAAISIGSDKIRVLYDSGDMK